MDFYTRMFPVKKAVSYFNKEFQITGLFSSCSYRKKHSKQIQHIQNFNLSDFIPKKNQKASIPLEVFVKQNGSAHLIIIHQI